MKNNTTEEGKKEKSSGDETTRFLKHGNVGGGQIS